MKIEAESHGIHLKINANDDILLDILNVTFRLHEWYIPRLWNEYDSIV